MHTERRNNIIILKDVSNEIIQKDKQIKRKITMIKIFLSYAVDSS